MLRALEDLAASERQMYELDHRKDQVMTVCYILQGHNPMGGIAVK